MNLKQGYISCETLSFLALLVIIVKHVSSGVCLQIALIRVAMEEQSMCPAASGYL